DVNNHTFLYSRIPTLRALNSFPTRRSSDLVARALDDLAEPPAGLRRVQAVRIGGGSLHVVDLPACEVRAADIPALALAVRCQNEGSLSRADQYSRSEEDTSELQSLAYLVCRLLLEKK